MRRRRNRQPFRPEGWSRSRQRLRVALVDETGKAVRRDDVETVIEPKSDEPR